MRSLFLTIVAVAISAGSAQASVFDAFDDLQPVSNVFNAEMPSLDLGGDTCCTGTCGDSCTDTGCCNSRRAGWTARVGYIHMWRQKTGSRFPILLTGPNTVYSSADFDFSSSPGIDVSLAYDNHCGQGFEVRYVWLDDFQSNQVQDFFGVTPATNPPTEIEIAFPDPWRIRYSSEIQTIELLGREALGQFEMSYGFRYAELNEELTLGRSIAPNPTYGLGTQNDLYGFQVGLSGPLWDSGHGLRVVGVGKTGIYLNQRQASANFGGNILEGADSDNTAAFLGEAGLRLEYDLTSNLSLSTGYQLMYFDGVALAADQLPNTGNLFNLESPIEVRLDKNSLLYHGLQVGLVYRF